MKLSELIEKHGNKEVDEQVVVNVLGLKTSVRPKFEDKYWFVRGDVCEETWINDKIDNFRYSQGNCFDTKEEAETYKRVLETEGKLKQFAKEHNEGVIDWGNAEQKKYHIYFEVDDIYVNIDWTKLHKTPREIYFTSEEIANAAVEAVGKEAVMEYLKYEW